MVVGVHHTTIHQKVSTRSPKLGKKINKHNHAEKCNSTGKMGYSKVKNAELRRKQVSLQKYMPEVASEEQSPFSSEAATNILASAPESNQSLQR